MTKIIRRNDMNKNILKADSKNGVGRILFYIFEICALIVGIIMFIMAIYNACKTESFMVFLNAFASVIFTVLALYGIGKIIDLLCYRNEK